ncbi:MAG: hypothetical protein IPM51_17300 [Sphingobacteriaceae bacterium]|nr:hypothetical protein [Sphingobacteriaceae bacterium]
MKYLFFLLVVVCFSFTTPLNLNYFNGEFKVKKSLNFNNSGMSNFTYNASCNLYTDSVSLNQLWKSQNLGEVLYNNIPLTYNNTINLYIDSAVRKTNQYVNWELKNSTFFTPFAVSIDTTFPSFSYHNCLPSIIDRSQNLEVILDSLNNVDFVEITSYNNLLGNLPYYRKFQPHNGLNQIIITKSELRNMSGSGTIVTISLIKNSFKRINGRNFKFEKRFDFVKAMPLVN